MAEFSQDNRPLRVTIGSVDPNGVLITRCAGTEAISRLYQYTLDLVAPVETPLKFEDVLGQAALVAIDEAGGPTRFIHGIVNRFSQGRRDETFVHYRAEIVPVLWLLTRQTRSRIFQQKTVKTILEEVIGNLYSPRFVLDGKYFERNYCVQYRESDFAFISRVMEEEGIYYYFTHTADGQELVISDSPRGHDPITEAPENAILHFLEGDAVSPNEGRIKDWNKLQELKTTTTLLTDHNFELPTNRLDITSIGIDTVKAGTVDHKTALGGMGDTAVVDHPGGYGTWSDGIAPGGAVRAGDLQNLFESNGRMGQVSVERELAGAVVIEGVSTYRRLVAGHKFTLADHFDADGEYVLTRVEHTADCGVGDSGDATSFTYGNRFTCLPSLVPFRPERETPRPTVKGTQTGVVVGDDPEIDPDKYGRVKVMFRWDPEGARGLDTSCWVRVAQFWAGKKWGAQFIPRVGDEVVVAFLEGNPDQPLVIGSVYNADNMPIYTLPANKTQSGIKTHSSPGGDDGNFNEIRFEDKKGAEQVVIHAEKDMLVSVENNYTLDVGGSSKGPPNRSGMSNTTVKGDINITSKTGHVHVTAETDIILTVGSSKLEMYKSGVIKLTGTEITIEGSTFVTAKPKLINLEGTSKVHVTGGGAVTDWTGNTITETASTSINMTGGGATTEWKGNTITATGSTAVHVTGGGATTDWTGKTITADGSAGVKITGATIKLNA